MITAPQADILDHTSKITEELLKWWDTNHETIATWEEWDRWWAMLIAEQIQP